MAYAATSGADGSFVLDEIPAGQYRLSAKRTGYLEQAYGSRAGQLFGARGMGMLVTLTAGQRMTGIDFQLVRQAIIAGKIVDEDGDPGANVTLQVLREIRLGGERQLLPVQNARPTTWASTASPASRKAPIICAPAAKCSWAPARIGSCAKVRKKSSPPFTTPAPSTSRRRERSRWPPERNSRGTICRSRRSAPSRQRPCGTAGRCRWRRFIRPLATEDAPGGTFVRYFGDGGPWFRQDGSFDFGGITPGS